MCALFGWLDCGGKLSHKTLKKLTQELANAAEERGTDASGISYVQNDNVKIYKKPKPAHKMRFNFPDNTSAIMGHTRFTTQGNQKFNYNNHPFMARLTKNLLLLITAFCITIRNFAKKKSCLKPILKLTAIFVFN